MRPTVYTIEGVDVLLLVFVTGGALNCLGMTIIVRIQIPTGMPALIITLGC